MNSTATKIVSLFSKRKRKARRAKVVDLRTSGDEPLPKKSFVEGKDVFLFGGLGLAGYGVWLIYPPSAYVLVGGVFVAIGVMWYLGEAKGGS